MVEYLDEASSVAAVVCTSQGAYSTCYLVSGENEFAIDRAILADPADYELGLDKLTSEVTTRAGHQSGAFESPTAASLLSTIRSEVNIDVIHFGLRNFGSDGYTGTAQRGQDNPDLYPRLSAEMVERFYTNTPEANRGSYLNLLEMPHVFTRDGDVQSNLGRLAVTVSQLLD